MRRAAIRSGAFGAPLLASLALALSMPAAAAAVHPPDVRTDKVLHLVRNQALLTGTVNAEGSPTTYFFEFGPTPAYGFHTATGNAGSAAKSVRVGQFATPFGVGYHYRIVATNAGGTKFGKDRVFLTRVAKLGLELFKPAEPAIYGTRIVVSGRVLGIGAGGHGVVLQASAYPYHEAFEPIGSPTVTNAAGGFRFRVGALRVSTQYRVVTLDALPRLSKVITEEIAARVVFKARSSGQPGLMRLYGTVTPVEVGARVEFQVQKPARPGKSEKKEERFFRFHTQSVTTVKRATRKFSRFSAVVYLRRTGRYRAFVITNSGAIVPGASRTLYLHAAPGRHKKH